MGDTKKSPANTRARKASLKEATGNISLSEVLDLIRASEDRVKQCVKDQVCSLKEKLCKIETTLCSVQNDCAHLETEICKIKDVISCQQRQIEAGERKLREKI